MNTQKQWLLVEQTDRKLELLKPIAKLTTPERGWLFTVRTALKMSLRQMGMRLNVSAQSIKEMEIREMNGSITLKSLREAATAMNMKLVYGLVPVDESIESMIEKRAMEKAREIVLRTSGNMRLEDQEVSKERMEKAIKMKAAEFKSKMPRSLWD